MQIAPTSTHDLPAFVKKYADSRFLLPPEKIVLEQLKSQLPKMRMLDIGVGGGRTTCYFGVLAKEYVAIDFDGNMIEACRKRFMKERLSAHFITCDVRSMEIFPDDYFDFILFSFNGIDYLTHTDRSKALREVKRIGRQGGMFLFSTHNLNSIISQSAVRRSTVTNAFRSPRKIPGSLWRRFVCWLCNANAGSLKEKQYAMVFDGEYCAKFTWLILSMVKKLGYYYYSRPQEQIRQLKDAGFEIIHIYSIEGKEIVNENDLNTTTEGWLHYLCRIPPNCP
jgi:ubiquinone/menaquinone biosynthesis C-methylase UbiE